MTKKVDINSLLEPFQIALSLEREGQRLFLEAAKNTSSKLARQTFEFLAKEEIKHIEKIQKFYDALAQSGGEVLPDTEDSEADEKLESFNKMLESLNDDFKATTSDVDAYRMALEFEGGTEVFYEQKLAEADNPRLKKFYKWLIDEEEMHSRLLKSCLRLLN